MLESEPAFCPECGAPGNACRARFQQFLALEFERPAYGEVHHLPVATFILQHSCNLTRESWLQERQLLQRFLINGETPAEVRREAGNRIDRRNRPFKITSRAGKPLHDRSRWTNTIMDVREQDAVVYCRDVEKWARATLEDTQVIRV